MVFISGLNHGLNQWFKPIGLNQTTLQRTNQSNLNYFNSVNELI